MKKNVVINSKTYDGIDKVRLKDTLNNNVDFIETSDSNAIESDIANGKTAYVNGIKITGTLKDKTLTTKNITANGTYNALSDNADGYSNVVVNVPGETINNQDKTIVSNGEYTADTGYTGLGTITVNVPSSINNQNKTVTPSTSQQTINADNGYSGLGTVTVNAVTNSIDENIVADNIKKDVSILGVVGKYEGGTTPTGTINITSNGNYDVTNYANALVNVSGGSSEETEPALPSGYTKYQYLESSGTQYIDTGLIIDKDWEFQLWRYGNKSNSYHNVFGVDGTFCQDKGASGASYVNFGDTVYINGGSAVFPNWAKLTKTGIYENILGREFHSLVADGGEPNQTLTMAILARHKTESEFDLPFKGKFYGMKISKNGSAVHWFLPAMRNSDETLGLYDAIGNQFYINNGTGTFTGEI